MKVAPRQYRNQRLFRTRQQRSQQLLEVSLRASKERARRMRVVASAIFKVLVFAALCAGAWIGTKEGLRRFVWENPSFFLSDVRVTSDGTLTREQILAIAGIVEGRNIFLTDFTKAREALDGLPQVERVELQRALPNRVDIEVTERQPIAWVAAKGDTDPVTSERSFLIDGRGFVMKPRKVLPEYEHLPVVSGVVTEDLAAGQKVSTCEMQAALELIRLNADSTRWQARDIDVSKGYCVVVTDRDRARITFGLDHIEKQLARLYRLLEVIEPTHREIQTVNLLVERNPPVTFLEPVGEESAAPQAALSGKSEAPKVIAEKAPAAKGKADVSAKPAPAETRAASASVKKGAASSKSKDKPSGSNKTSAGSLRKPFRL